MDSKNSIDEVKKSLNKTSRFTINSTEEFNRSIDHIIQLIEDSYTLYKMKSFSTSAFISIAIIEEVAKIHMGLYIKDATEIKKNKDPLRNHISKQIIGSNYTISFGERLKNAIGMNEIDVIFRIVYSGELKDLREKALYCDREMDRFIIPSECISEDFSRKLLLFAIESFDDNLVGYSNYSIEESKRTDEIFEEISKNISTTITT